MTARNRLAHIGSALLAATLLLIVGYFITKPWFGPHYPMPGSDFIYIKTEKLGCEGSFCSEEVQQSIRYYYQTDLTLAQVVQILKNKGLDVKGQQTDTVAGTQETTLVLSNGSFVIYGSPSGETGKRAVVAIEATTAERLANK